MHDGSWITAGAGRRGDDRSRGWVDIWKKKKKERKMDVIAVVVWYGSDR